MDGFPLQLTFCSLYIHFTPPETRKQCAAWADLHPAWKQVLKAWLETPVTLDALPGENVHRIHLESFLTGVTAALNTAMAAMVGGHVLKTKLVTQFSRVSMNPSTQFSKVPNYEPKQEAKALKVI